MNKEKENNSILTEPLVKFFRGKNFGFLGTLNKDGSPQVMPTWIDIVEKQENEEEHEGIILINTAKGRIKQKNVSRDPRVSMKLTHTVWLPLREEEVTVFHHNAPVSCFGLYPHP